MAAHLRRPCRLAGVALILLPSVVALRSRVAQEPSELEPEDPSVGQQLADYRDLPQNGSNLTDWGEAANRSDAQPHNGGNPTVAGKRANDSDVQPYSGGSPTVGGERANDSDEQPYSGGRPTVVGKKANYSDLQPYNGSNLTIGGPRANNSDEYNESNVTVGSKKKSDSPEIGNVSKAVPVRQLLFNYHDLQYSGNVTIGGQNVTGILDTGSFELVVFSKHCETCGIAGLYDEKTSSTFMKGTLTKVHGYGSGKCTAIDAYDTVHVGAFDTVAARSLGIDRQAIWLAKDCEMKLLQKASFNAIVGIGPPGQPVHSAKRALDKLKDKAKGYERWSLPVPDELLDQIAEQELELEIAAGKKSMLENFGVTTFSECLGKDKGSPGVLVWNDDTRRGEPGVLEIPVDGSITWSIKATDLALGYGWFADIVACRDGCGALVDTGTSMFALPTDLYDDFLDAVNSYIRAHKYDWVKPDCNDLSAFPDVVINFGGEMLSFPPSSYLGLYHGQMSKEVSQFIRMDKLEYTRCRLLLMDTGKRKDTFMGPMIIMGMPFFREYYTTFDLGDGRSSSRSLFLSKTGESCEPAGANVVHSADRRGAHHRAYAYQPRQVDLSKLRVPDWVDRLEGEL